MRKKIKTLEQTATGFDVTEKNGSKKEYIVADTFEEVMNIYTKKQPKHPVILVTKNTKQNIDTLLTNWKSLAEHKTVHAMFVHPDENTYWHVCPKTHEFITDKDNIKDSIYKLHSTVTHTK